MLLEWIINQVEYFLDQFWRVPGGGGVGGEPLSLEKIIRYESTHFLLSGGLALLAVYVLIGIISSRRNSKELDHSTLKSCYLFGVCISVTTHILIDAYTKLC